jgi:hypothetical protein
LIVEDFPEARKETAAWWSDRVGGGFGQNNGWHYERIENGTETIDS